MENLYKNSYTHKIISRDIASGMLNHSYMIISSDKLLINKLADFVACEILCERDESPCGECNTCLRVMHNNHSDVKKYPAESKAILTDDINQIVSESYVLPLEAEKKIYILKNFDEATVQAQNKILKTLEEPCKSVVFVLTTTNENNVLATIRSRCKKIVEPQVSSEVVEEYIKSKSQLSSDEIKSIVQISCNNLTIAESYVGDEKSLGMRQLAEDIFINLKNSADVLKYSFKMQIYKNTIEGLLNSMLMVVDEMFVSKTKGICDKYPINEYSTRALVEIAKRIKNAVKKHKANCNINTITDGLLLEILEVKFKCLK